MSAPERHHYVFLRPCGCPEALTEATPRRRGGPPRISGEDAAWEDVFATRAEERAARTRGVRVVHVDHATYERDLLPLWQCRHSTTTRPAPEVSR